MPKVVKILSARAVSEGHWKKNSVDKQGKTLLLLRILMAGLWGFQYCAEEAGYDNWLDWLHKNTLNHWDGKRNLASHVRSFVASSLVTELEILKTERDLG